MTLVVGTRSPRHEQNGMSFAAQWCDPGNSQPYEFVNDMIVVRDVNVDRKLPPTALPASIKRNQLIEDDEVLWQLPRGEGENVDVYFFRSKVAARYTLASDREIDAELEERGLVPADWYSLSEVNKKLQTFADEFPNCTHWQDPRGVWYFIGFSTFCGWPTMRIESSDKPFGKNWWHAGILPKRHLAS